VIQIKTPEEIEIMSESGAISAAALEKAVLSVREGITLRELDKIAEDVITGKGAASSFKTVEDYPYTTCINVNDGIVHGIPGSYKLKNGDLVSIDLGALYKGFHTDLSWTVEVGASGEAGASKEQKFLDTGKKALNEAIFYCVEGNKLGQVSRAIQKVIESAGYTVSRELVGHGVGKELHEDPYVPGYGKSKDGPVLKAGMVLAIEVIYQKGSPKIVLDDDDWTLRTADGSLSGLFELTVAVGAKEPRILTPIQL
jgi:methionyl aminopeptidase